MQLTVLYGPLQRPGSYDVTVSDSGGCTTKTEGALNIISDVTVSMCAIDASFGYTAANTDVIITATADGKVGSATCSGKSGTFASSPRAWLVVDGTLKPIGNVAFVSAAALTGTVPAGVPIGTYDLLVQNPDGAVGRLAGAFHVVGKPGAPTKITDASAHVYAVGGANTAGAQSDYESALVKAGGALGAWAKPTGSGASIMLTGVSGVPGRFEDEVRNCPEGGGYTALGNGKYCAPRSVGALVARRRHRARHASAAFCSKINWHCSCSTFSPRLAKMSAALSSLSNNSIHPPIEPVPASAQPPAVAHGPMPGSVPPPAVAKKKERRRPAALKWLLWIGGAALLSLGIIPALFFYRRAHRTAGPHYETVQVDRGRIVARVTASGTLSALVTVQVGSQVSGRVEELKVDFNAKVRKGQVIARIEPRLFQAALEQARANHAAARGNLAKAQAQAADARRQYLRSKALAAKDFISQADLDTAETSWRAAVANVASSQGALEQTRAAEHQARINLDYTTILSPTDGIVISRNVDVGQTVAATLAAPTLFVIAEDLRKMQVDTSVAESDVGKLRDGMPATFTVDAYGSETFSGVVRQVRNAPQTIQNVVTYDAVLDVANPDLRLRPGMTANVNFVYGEKTSALRVPNAALRFRAPTDWLDAAHVPRRMESSAHRLVWVLRSGKPAPVTIRIGISDGTFTEQVEGPLNEHELLITDAGGTSAVPPAMRRVL